MKSGKRFGIYRRICALALAAVLALPLVACGNSSEDGGQAKEWIWVPEYITVGEENIPYYDMQLVGDALCYTSYDWDEATGESYQIICKYSLTDRSKTSVPITWLEEGGIWGLNRTTYAEDGSMCGLVNHYNEDFTESLSCLCKFDANGRQVFSQEITDLLGDSFMNLVAMDGEGRIYVSGESNTGESNIWLFDAEGNQQGKVLLETGDGWISSMGCGKDGRMYVCYYCNNGINGYGLAEIDFDGKRIGATYDNFSGGTGDRLIPGIEKDFLAVNGGGVYEYDLKTQEQEELFSWLDSDIDGNNVHNFSVLEDGRILVILMDWKTNENSIALLTRTKADEVVQKETIVLASLQGGPDLQNAVVRFNRESDRYRIDVRSYIDSSNWDGNDYEARQADALNRLNNDIISNNCPDIIDLSGLNIEQMAAKGIFEDLSGYLEKSSKVDRSDFVEQVLDSYTFDDKLITIPYRFMVHTVAAKASDVGSEMGWSVDELIAYADAHPDAQLFDNVSKSVILQFLMECNTDAFIDWFAGECYFDSDAFKRLLQFAKRFPDEVEWDSEDLSTPNKIQKGMVLLYDMNIVDFRKVQLAEEIFQGDATLIGCPTMDGSAGSMLTAFQSYAIASKSKQKDGAWEFIEGFLTQEVNPDRVFGFPTLKLQLEAMAEEAVKPIIKGSGGGFSYGDGWSYEYRNPTQEEVDMVMELIEIARPVFDVQGDEVMKIINEEAEAFYKGQKTVDEVAAIIQSRVKIYVGENR